MCIRLYCVDIVLARWMYSIQLHSAQGRIQEFAKEGAGLPSLPFPYPLLSPPSLLLPLRSRPP